MAIDNHATVSINGPIRRWVTVSPSDSADLAEIPTCLYLGHDGAAGPAEGNVRMQGVDGGDIGVFRIVPGVRLECRPKRVYATGTTAGLVILAGYPK